MINSRTGKHMARLSIDARRDLGPGVGELYVGCLRMDGDYNAHNTICCGRTWGDAMRCFFAAEVVRCVNANVVFLHAN